MEDDPKPGASMPPDVPGPSQPPSPSKPTLEDKLWALNRVLSLGVITEEEYKTFRARVLKDF